MENKKPDDRNLIALLLLLGVVLMIIFASLSSCCPCRHAVTPTPVPEIHYVHDTVKVAERHDSIIYKDVLVKDSSSFVQKGDTVTIERWHWERDYTREKILEAKLDSVSHVKRDSIPYPVPVEVEVPAKLTNWQVFLITLGKISIVVFILLIVIAIIRLRF